MGSMMFHPFDSVDAGEKRVVDDHHIIEQSLVSPRALRAEVILVAEIHLDHVHGHKQTRYLGAESEIDAVLLPLCEAMML